MVLDTNVVLDWLLFRDPACAGLAEQVARKRLVWHATAAMRAELAHVLRRPRLRARSDGGAAVLAQFDLRARLTPPAAAVADAPSTPRCADPHDQMFIDLALAVGARWLLSRDRALLALHAAAGRRGVEVLPPGEWNTRYGSDSAAAPA